MADFLPANLRRDQALQTRHLGEVTQTLAQMEDSLSSIRDSVTGVSCNSLAFINCFNELQTATAGVGQEVHALTQAVQANTAALTVGLNRIAVALKGRPAGGQSPGEAPPSPASPP